MEYIHHYISFLGDITVASDGEELTGLWFDGQKYFACRHEEEHEEKQLPIFDKIDEWLDIYFHGKAPNFTPNVNLKIINGTDFQKTVWKIIFSIPYGKTMTYSEIANLIANKRNLKNMSAQAVGGAVGRNPISLIIPCHRVIGASGDLRGYAAGIYRKIRLLEMEGKEVIHAVT